MALNYLHSRKIVHRDIKLENVLMQTKEQDNLAIKITDFGFARFFDPAKGLSDVLGSPLYMAPEILLKKSYGTSVDIWAAGVLLHILMVGEPPYIADTKKEIFEMIKKQDVPFKKYLFDKVSPVCTEFVMSMLVKDPLKRPTAAELLKHKWFEVATKQSLDKSSDLIEIVANIERYREATMF